MRRLFASTLLAVLTAGALVALAQGQPPSPQPVPVRVQPPAAIDVFLFSAINAGKLIATTAADGRGRIDPKELEGLGRLELTEERCDDMTRVLAVAADGTLEPAKPNCRRRRVGAFWWGRDTALNVRLTGAGMSTPMKAGLIGGGAAALAGVAIAAGGGDSTSGPGGNATGFNGTYTGTLTASTNTCPFSPTAAISGVLNVATNGQGTWQKSHVSAGITFNFTVNLNVSSSTAASFTATTSQVVGSRTFTVTDVVSISGTTITISQTFTSTTGAACTVIYSGQLTRV